MILLEIIFIAILLGLIFKKFKLYSPKLIVIFIAIQLLLRVLNFNNQYVNQSIEILNILIAIYIIIRNIKQIGTIIFGLGFILNQLVMCLNMGRMPVLIANTMMDNRHIILSNTTRLPMLGDIFTPIGELSSVMILSAGDLLVFLGISIIVFQMIYYRKIN